MTARLAQAMREAAEAAPGVRVPEDLWWRGRRARRRRRFAASLTCLLVVIAGILWTPLHGRTTAGFAGAGPDVLPSAVAEPYLWQQTFGAAPNGPAKLVFETGHSLNLETAVVLVGQEDDSYRLIYLPPGDETGSLSPDGRYLLRHNLLDLTTGQVRALSPEITGFAAGVWSPDSRTAVGVIEHDADGIDYGPNNEPLNDPERADDIVLVDVVTGRVRTLTTAHTSDWRASFSPDGGRVAMSLGRAGADQRLVVLDVATGAVLLSVPLTDRQRLAGPAAWTPDGRQILLAHGDGCAWTVYCGTNPEQPNLQVWHVQRIDTATGAIGDDESRLRGWPELVAWRDGQPVVQIAPGYRLACETSVLTTSGPRPLPLRVAGHGCGAWARDLLERGRLGGPAVGPSPWQAQWWAYALPTVLLLAAASMVAVRVRRARNAARRDPTVAHRS